MGLFSALGDLFGGGDEIKQRSALSDEQEQMMTQLFGTLTQQLSADQSATPYGKKLIPALIPELRGLRSQIGQLDPYAGQGTLSSILDQLQATAMEPSYKVDQNTTQKYFQDSVVAPAMRAFERQIAPRIDAAYNTGAGLTSRSGWAKSEALGGLSTSFASELARIMQGNQALEAQLAEGAANRRVGALTQAGSLAQAMGSLPYQRLAAMQGMLGMYQGRRDSRAQGAYQEFLRTAPENNTARLNSAISQALGYVGVPAIALQQQRSTTGQVFDAIGSGASGLAGLNMLGNMGGFGQGTQGIPLWSLGLLG